MSNILVTGGAGFIGSHTCLSLLQKGNNIFVIDSFVNSSSESLKRIKDILKLNKNSLNGSLNFQQGDIRDLECVRNIFRRAKNYDLRINSVLHFAGLKAVGESVSDPLKYWDCNVIGTINLLKVMEEFNCFNIVFSSSATIYGNALGSIIKENSIIQPTNPYGKTKSTIENILNDLQNSSPAKWRIANLRYFNPIGAHPSGLMGEDPLGMPNNIFPIINRVAAGKIRELNIFGNNWPTPDGTGIRDYIHVMDLAEGHVLALKYLEENEPQIINLNLGTGKGTSVLELVNIFQEINNVKVPYIFTSRRPGDAAVTVADNSLALKILDWKPSKTIADMCKDSWAWQSLYPSGYRH